MNSNCTIREIEYICFNVRLAIDKVKHTSILLKSFPHGTCRDSSLILSHCLLEYAGIETSFCSRNFEDGIPSHSWLEYQETLIDITADQFDFAYPPVIVRNSTTRGALHRQDRIQKPDWSIAGMDAPALFSDYKFILEHITL